MDEEEMGFKEICAEVRFGKQNGADCNGDCAECADVLDGLDIWDWAKIHRTFPKKFKPTETKQYLCIDAQSPRKGEKHSIVVGRNPDFKGQIVVYVEDVNEQNNPMQIAINRGYEPDEVIVSFAGMIDTERVTPTTVRLKKVW
jgi:hypothetical protein